jgi:hypothetical protein
MPLPSDSPRAEILNEAVELICGDRNAQYGPPTQDFARTAALLNALGYRGPGNRDILMHDVAVMVSMVKYSRMVHQWWKRDTWADIGGYTGCGWECVVEELAEQEAAAARKSNRLRFLRLRKLRRWPRGSS